MAQAERTVVLQVKTPAMNVESTCNECEEHTKLQSRHAVYNLRKTR